MPTNQIVVRLLGGLQLEAGSRKVDRFATRRIGALLAYLTFYPDRPHAREKLIDLFWPEMEQAAAAHNLRQTLYSLRRLLEPLGASQGTVLITDRIFIRLHPQAIRTDVAEFHRALKRASKAKNHAESIRFLTEAINLYQGELLPGEYEEWVEPERARLAQEHRNALQALAALWEKIGDTDAAAHRLKQLLDLDPMDEESCLLLMRLHTSNGRAEEALALFERLYQTLTLQLGMQPSAHVQTFADALRNQYRLPLPAPLDSAPTLPSPAIPLALQPALPIALTRFFGRETEIEQICERFLTASARLLTLTGPGGSGKTRLALEVAHHLQRPFAGRTWFVSLAELNSPDLIEGAVVQALHLSPTDGFPLTDQLARLCGGSPALLTFDNFEHLVEEGAEIVVRLLTAVPTLSCLITSRECLRVAGEQEMAILPLPTPSTSDPPETLVLCPSVRLFQDRAQGIRPGFAVTRHNATAVAALCARLEGIPLAIELAAARIAAFTPAQMLEQMADRFALLTARRRGVPLRHQTLRAAIEWSFENLPDDLKRVFASLSIFPSGWTVETARAVVGEEATAQALERLRECSLIQVSEAEKIRRFRMLETLRAYGQEKLSPEEAEQLSAALAHKMLPLAERTIAEYNANGDVLLLEQLLEERDNFRAVLDWLESDRSRIALQCRLLLAIAESFQMSGHWTEIRTLLEAAADNSVEAVPALHSELLEWVGMIATRQADFEYASQILYRVLESERLRNNPEARLITLNRLVNVELLQDHYPRAFAIAEEALLVAQHHDFHNLLWEFHVKMGEIALHQGNYRAAEEHLERSLGLANHTDPISVGNIAVEQGVLALSRGDYAGAIAFCTKGRRLLASAGHRANTAWAESKQGLALLLQGDVAAADRLFVDCLETYRQLGDRRHVAFLLHDRARAARCLGNDNLAQTLLVEALALARQIRHRRSMALALGSLGHLELETGRTASARERLTESLTLRRQIGDLRMIAEGWERMAALAHSEGDLLLAAQYLSAPQSLRERIGAPVPPLEQRYLSNLAEALRAALGEDRFQMERREGAEKIPLLASPD